MKIVVLVKHVPEPTSAWQFADDRTVDREGMDGRLSELDEYAVEQALSLVEKGFPATVTYLTMGPDRAVEGLRKALAMGGDEGVHISDESLHGSDSLATSLVLARALERTGFDLVISGMASTDGEMSVVPAMVADRLDIPQVTFASALSVTDGAVTISRDDDTAMEEVVADLPALVSVTDRTGEVRYPSFKGILAGKKKPVSTLTLADLGIDPRAVGTAGAATAVRAVAPKPPRQAGEVVVDDGTAASQVADFLVAQKLL